tara:strand:+ start:590 stop:868 length:279 start_codon:yes stop_codon:yes gene_type:complete
MTVSAPAKPRRARKRKSAPSTPVLAIASAPVVKQGRSTRELTKPTAEIIPFDSYIKDARNRWNVHRYEIQELLKDIGNTYDYIRETYKRVTT